MNWIPYLIFEIFIIVLTFSIIMKFKPSLFEDDWASISNFGIIYLMLNAIYLFLTTITLLSNQTTTIKYLNNHI